jgi:predicted MFS family arabinose efflux permease
LLYLCAFVIGLGFVVHSAAASSLLPHLAQGEELARANGLMFAVENGGLALVGPAVGGVAFAVGHWVPFAIDAVTFAASASLLAALRDRSRPVTVGAGRAPIGRRLLRQPLLRPLYLTAVGLAIVQALVLSSLVLFGRDALGLTPRGFGLFMGITAIGNVAGGLVTPRLWRGRRRTGALLVAVMIGYGFSYLVLAVSHDPVTACVVLTVEAFAVGMVSTISPTLRLEHADGRAGAVATFFRQGIYVAHAVGGVAAGFMIARLGFTTTYTIAGLGALSMLVFVPSIARQVKPIAPGDGEDLPAHDPIATTMGLVGATHSAEADASPTPIRWEPPLVPDRSGW